MSPRLAILLVLLTVLQADAQNPAVTVAVDVSASRRAINPAIYGVAYATPAQLADLNVPVHRLGGNNTTRYNCQLNADNRGNDWYYESIAESSAAVNGRIDSFIAESQAAGAQAMITIPIIGWIAKLGPSRGKLASFSQAKYGAQTGNDWQWMPDAGNGILRSTNQPIVNNDPNDANVPNNSAFQRGCVQAIVNRWGTAASGGLRYYILDNEHSIWHATHRDVQPAGATMDDVLARMKDYAAQIKAVDPGAQIVGPEEWGWSGYILSGYDQQYGSQHGWGYMPDRTAHGNSDYLPWLLAQLKADGRRLLDVFSVHYYPQGGEFSEDTSTSMQLRRNRSTRSLWDANYTDETWIADKVRLVPRLRAWADTYYYAGTPIAITEYNWGAEGHMNGATAQADIYGIFGREGLDIGARWTTPATSSHVYKAMKMYRNYDGAKSTFGDVSVRATVPNPDNVAAFAAERTSDGSLTVMLINKYLSGATPVSVTLANFTAGTAAQVYQLTSSNAIARLADANVASGAVALTLPQQSVTLIVVPKAAGTNQPPVAAAAATPSTGAAPLAVAFSAAGSNDPDGSIASYAWTFGDNTLGSGASVNHTYTNAGTYTAVLTVTDDKGATGTKSLTITVNAPANQPPVANATATPSTGTAPLAVAFSAAGSNDPDGSIASYGWAFGDNTSGSGAAVNHTYTNAGTYTAVLTVTDNKGATATRQLTIVATAGQVVLNAPSNLLGDGRRGSALLRWRDNSSNEGGFYIERARSGSTAFTRVGTVAANVVTFTNAVTRGTYLYRVQAYQGSSVSGYSNVVSVRVR